MRQEKKKGYFSKVYNVPVPVKLSKLFMEENCVCTRSLLTFVIMLLKIILCSFDSTIFGKVAIFQACSPHLVASLQQLSPFTTGTVMQHFHSLR